MQTTTYQVDGMTCGGCVRSVERAVARKLPDVEVDVRLDDGAVDVRGEHDASVLVEAIRGAGFEVRVA